MIRTYEKKGSIDRKISISPTSLVLDHTCPLVLALIKISIQTNRTYIVRLTCRSTVNRSIGKRTLITGEPPANYTPFKLPVDSRSYCYGNGRGKIDRCFPDFLIVIDENVAKCIQLLLGMLSA